MRLAMKDPDGRWIVYSGLLKNESCVGVKLSGPETLMAEATGFARKICWFHFAILLPYTIDISWLCEKLAIAEETYDYSLWSAELLIDWVTSLSEEIE